MSQFWHAHWAEDGFKPTRLQNWEVPKWHAQWPDRHCTTTKFEAHANGRLFANFKKSGSPWGNFKGTWELPVKINRKTAEEISRTTEHKKSFWRSHQLKHERICRGQCTGSISCKGKVNLKQKKKERNPCVEHEKDEKLVEKEIPEESKLNDGDAVESDCGVKKACSL